MTRPLIIGPDEKKNIKAVIDYANKHPYTIKLLQKIMEGKLQPPGDDKNHVAHIPFGYRCVYSIELQKVGIFRHLSISVDADGKWPNEYAVKAIAKEFGFRGDLSDWILFPEKEIEAINIMQRLPQ